MPAPIPPPGIAAARFSSEICVMTASVVSSNDAIDAAFCRAERTTLVGSITGGDNNHWANNLKLTEIAGLIRTGFQAPGIRAIDFGIGVGAMAMGLRLWLSLDKGGASI